MVTAALAAMLGASIWSIAANATPAFTVQVGAGNGTTCDGLNVLIRNSSTPVDANHNCSGRSGTESASAVSTYGSVGARAAATTKTNFSVDQGDGALATFSDTLVFSRTNDALPSNVRVSANMAVHVGQLLSGNGPGGFANAVAVIGIKLGTFSQLQYTSRSDQGFPGR